MTVCVIDIPRSYLFELSETVFDTGSLELFDDVGDPENFPKTGEIIRIQTKYGWLSADGVQTGDLGTLLNPQV